MCVHTHWQGCGFFDVALINMQFGSIASKIHIFLYCNDLLGHPAYGASWEGLAIENIISAYPGWKTSFYRSASGAEIDLILEKGRRRIAVEVKASTSPEVKRSYWNALDDLNVDEAWIVSPVREAYPYKRGVSVRPLDAIAIPEGA